MRLPVSTACARSGGKCDRAGTPLHNSAAEPDTQAIWQSDCNRRCIRAFNDLSRIACLQGVGRTGLRIQYADEPRKFAVVTDSDCTILN